MPSTRIVSAFEYEALLNVEKMVRLAMSKPATGEFLVGAILALDAVRKTEAEEIAAMDSPQMKAINAAVSDALVAGTGILKVFRVDPADVLNDSAKP